MNIDTLQALLGWCAIINMGLLLWWLAFITLAHDWVYNMHTRWLSLSTERFDAIHYAGMALFKLSIFFFNIVPYLALRIIS